MPRMRERATKSANKPIGGPAMKPLDARAKKILFDTYWTSKGWINDHERKVPSAADRAHAKQHGMWFEPLAMGHDALLKQTKQLAKRIAWADVTAAFLASLSTRRLDLRSGVVSYADAIHSDAHKFDGTNPQLCATCWLPKDLSREDCNVLNFERHKWGGIRIGRTLYTYVDLVCLARELPVTPTAEDRAMFQAILARVGSAPAKTTPTQLSKRLDGVFPSNKNERDVVIEILAAVGILRARKERNSENEWNFAADWRGADGYDKKAVRDCFGMHGIKA
jgi:hypothetical protein